MTDSALLKVDRATKHVRELNELFHKKRPFVWVVETNTKTGERFLFVKNNEAVVNEAALICGDIIHNIRASLDHAYWEIISPHCTSDKERRAVQFPFTRKADALHKTLQDAHAHRGGTGFYCAMRALRLHGERGGNELLSIVIQADNSDKHRLLIPTIDDAQITKERLVAAIPDWPMINRAVRFNGFTGRVRWVNPSIGPWYDLGIPLIPSANVFERELNFPVGIVLQVGAPERSYPMVPTLNKLVDAGRETILLFREAANSY